MTIGEAIRKAREEKGYSRERLARRIGVHRHTIGHWELDYSSPSILSVEAIADVFNMSIDDLIGRERRRERVKS